MTEFSFNFRASLFPEKTGIGQNQTTMKKIKMKKMTIKRRRMRNRMR